MMPFVKNLWKKGYTIMTGRTTTTVTVIRIDVAVAAVARAAAMLEDVDVLLMTDFRLLAWFIYWYRTNCSV
jgi:hypothetical protein